MGEREYYLENDEATAKIRNAFRAHVQKMYQLAGFDRGYCKKGMEVVMDVETRLAKVSALVRSCVTRMPIITR